MRRRDEVAGSGDDAASRLGAPRGRAPDSARVEGAGAHVAGETEQATGRRREWAPASGHEAARDGVLPDPDPGECGGRRGREWGSWVGVGIMVRVPPSLVGIRQGWVGRLVGWPAGPFGPVGQGGSSFFCSFVFCFYCFPFFFIFSTVLAHLKKYRPYIKTWFLHDK